MVGKQKNTPKFIKFPTSILQISLIYLVHLSLQDPAIRKQKASPIWTRIKQPQGRIIHQIGKTLNH